MKKIFAFAIAALAISFASCGGKTAATSEPDSLACEQGEECAQCPKKAAADVVAQLQEALENADAEQVKAVGQTVAQKVSEYLAEGKTEAAEAYAAIVNNFVAENAETLQKIGAATAVTDALATVEGAPASLLESATNAANGVKEATVDAAKAQAEEAVDAAKETAAAAVDAAKAKAEETVDAAKAKAQEAVETAKTQADEAVEAGKAKAQEAASSAAKKALGL